MPSIEINSAAITMSGLEPATRTVVPAATSRLATCSTARSGPPSCGQTSNAAPSGSATGSDSASVSISPPDSATSAVPAYQASNGR